jgi:hypothetical protein
MEHRLIQITHENRAEYYDLVRDELKIASNLKSQLLKPDVGLFQGPVKSELEKLSVLPNYLENSVIIMWQVLTELKNFVVMSDGDYLSILYYNDRPLIMVTAWVRKGELFQQRITKFPSFWIYNLENPQEETRDVAMVLHSITSYKMCQIYPNLKILRILQPFRKMREILDRYGYKQTIELDEKYLNLWRTKINVV